MKLLIATRADENIKSLTDLTHPIIQKFAENWKADFISLNKNANCEGNGKFHFRIMEFYNLFEKYDRILSLDSDILVLPNCPNLFEEVPKNKIGTVFEDKGTRQKDRRKRIALSQEKFGNINWKKNYINTGVFLVSKIHKNIFSKINNQYYNDLGFDDVHLGYLINKYQFPIHELNYKFNHMSMFSEKWNGSPNEENSYIIHYAGKTGQDRINKIKNDIKRFYQP